MTDANRFISLFSTARDYFSSDYIAYTEIDADRNMFLHWITDDHQADVHYLETPYNSQSVCSSVIHAGGTVAICNIEDITYGAQCPFMLAESLASYLGAPVYGNDRCVGAFEVFCKSKRFWSPSDKRNVRTCADLVQAINTPIENRIVAVSGS